jgi:hypothetical protein
VSGEELPPAVGQLDRVPAAVSGVLGPTDELLLLQARQDARERLRLDPLGCGDLARGQLTAPMQLPEYGDARPAG